MESPKAHIDFLTGTRELATLTGGTAIGISATFNGQTHDCGNITGASSIPAAQQYPNAGRNGPAYFRAFASSDQAGTLNIEQSPDGVNWFVTDTASIVAGFLSKSVYIESKVVLRYVRAQLVNSTVAQTEVEFDTALVSI